MKKKVLILTPVIVVLVLAVAILFTGCKADFDPQDYTTDPNWPGLYFQVDGNETRAYRLEDGKPVFVAGHLVYQSDLLDVLILPDGGMEQSFRGRGEAGARYEQYLVQAAEDKASLGIPLAQLGDGEVEVRRTPLGNLLLLRGDEARVAWPGRSEFLRRDDVSARLCDLDGDGEADDVAILSKYDYVEDGKPVYEDTLLLCLWDGESQTWACYTSNHHLLREMDLSQYIAGGFSFIVPLDEPIRAGFDIAEKPVPEQVQLLKDCTIPSAPRILSRSDGSYKLVYTAYDDGGAAVAEITASLVYEDGQFIIQGETIFALSQPLEPDPDPTVDPSWTLMAGVEGFGQVYAINNGGINTNLVAVSGDYQWKWLAEEFYSAGMMDPDGDGVEEMVIHSAVGAGGGLYDILTVLEPEGDSWTEHTLHGLGMETYTGDFRNIASFAQSGDQLTMGLLGFTCTVPISREIAAMEGDYYAERNDGNVALTVSDDGILVRMSGNIRKDTGAANSQWDHPLVDSFELVLRAEYKDGVFEYTPLGIESNGDRTEILATWQADLDHDGVDDTIAVTQNYDEGDTTPWWDVTVTDAEGDQMWSRQVYSFHAGWNGIYLYEKEGKQYLMEWLPYGSTGGFTYHYSVYSLAGAAPDNNISILADGTFEYFAMNEESVLAIDTDAMRAFEAEVNSYLADAMVLLVMDEDTGGLRYSTADKICKEQWTSPADRWDEMKQNMATTLQAFDNGVELITLDGCLYVRDNGTLHKIFDHTHLADLTEDIWMDGSSRIFATGRNYAGAGNIAALTVLEKKSGVWTGYQTNEVYLTDFPYRNSVTVSGNDCTVTISGLTYSCTLPDSALAQQGDWYLETTSYGYFLREQNVPYLRSQICICKGTDSGGYPGANAVKTITLISRVDYTGRGGYTLTPVALVEPEYADFSVADALLHQEHHAASRAEGFPSLVSEKAINIQSAAATARLLKEWFPLYDEAGNLTHYSGETHFYSVLEVVGQNGAVQRKLFPEVTWFDSSLDVLKLDGYDVMVVIQGQGRQVTVHPMIAEGALALVELPLPALDYGVGFAGTAAVDAASGTITVTVPSTGFAQVVSAPSVWLFDSGEDLSAATSAQVVTLMDGTQALELRQPILQGNAVLVTQVTWEGSAFRWNMVVMDQWVEVSGN